MVRVFSGKTGHILHTFQGESSHDHLGRSIAGAGDVDLDGFTDIIAGAPHGAAHHGYARVYSGKDGSVTRTHVGDAAFDEFGWDVGGAGDVDADAFADVAVGAPHHGAPGFEAGITRVYSGRTGLAVYTFSGSGKLYWFGSAVSAGGDGNADGFPDIVAGEPQSKVGGFASGAARLMSGKDGTTLCQVHGRPSDALGFDVAMVGDTNGDGYDDLLLGAPLSSANGLESGRAVLVSGKNGTVLGNFVGGLPQDRFGQSVAAAGDIDQDGFDDLLIGSPDTDASGIDSGIARVTSGKNGSTLQALSNEEVILTHFGVSVASAGDVTNDGVPDIIVGAPLDSTLGADAGRAWIYSGACASAVELGIAGAGSGGYLPRIAAAGGPPRLGNSKFRIVVTDALGGANAALFIGTGTKRTNAKWGSLYIDPAQPMGIVPLVLGGPPGQAGSGTIIIAAPVPTPPQLVGFTGYLQLLIGDPGSTGGIAHSGALEVTVCQ